MAERVLGKDLEARVRALESPLNWPSDVKRLVMAVRSVAEMLEKEREISELLREQLAQLELRLPRLEMWANEEQHCQPLRPEDYQCGDPREAPNAATHCPHDWADQ